MRQYAALAALILFAVALAPAAREPQSDVRLKHAFRQPARNGWIFVHLEGSPSEIGYQHGYLLSREIEDAQRAVALSLTNESKDWKFFRNAAETALWPHVPAEYQAEIRGITEGLNARGVKLDVWDITALNAWLEFTPYYVNWYEKEHKTGAAKLPAPEHCSAFVATGSYTKDGKIVIGHNNWTDYLTGSRWNIIFDITPSSGFRFIMDGMPGLIHSGDDFGVNSAGIIITETTISQFNGFDPAGIPEFARARKAMQYSASIDDFARIMKEGNNGGYANDWLIADRNTNEIASLELGLKHVELKRTKDGYFVGANFPINPDLARDETDFDLKNKGNSPNARHARWEQLMAENKGKIDVAAGQRFLADHFDSFDKREQPDERTLCGHIDLSSRGSRPWQPPYGPAGAVQAKVTDAALAARMSLTASLGHPCGIHFKAARHLAGHPEFAWQKPLLRDLDSHPWTVFAAEQRTGALSSR
jgi:hypothetical protein